MRANPEAAAYVGAMRAIAQGPWVEPAIYEDMKVDEMVQFLGLRFGPAPAPLSVREREQRLMEADLR